MLVILPENSSSFLQEAWDKDWIVYAKKPFPVQIRSLPILVATPTALPYANHRIKAIDDSG